MILTRKLILPALIVFAALLAGIFAFTYVSLHNTYHASEESDLVSYSDAFLAELENQKNVALALASTAAGNPSIQEAFAARDREKLIELTLANFELLKTYNITQYQYHLPNGERFLSLNDLDDLEAGKSLSVVVLANTEQMPVAGLESENGLLGVRGVVPIYYQGNHIGSVELGIGVNDALLSGLKEKYGGEWHILLSEDLLAGTSQPSVETGPIPALILYATTQDNSLFNSTPSYVSVLDGQTAITHPSIAGRDYAILTSPLRDFSGKIVGVLDIVYDHTHISDVENNSLLITGLVSILALLLGSLSLVIFTSRTLRPIQTLTQAAAAIADGNITGFVATEPGNDEIGTLTTAFQRMTTQLNNSITDLEKRVADRTHDLESQTRWLRVAAEIVRDAASARNLDELLTRSTSLILERFKFYHTGIFLLDNNNEYAVLAASATDAGRLMIANNYKVRVGEVGIVGHVSASGEPQVILNKGIDAVHFNNPFLPDTRTQLAVPLKVESRVIGVLDVQSEQAQAFNAEEIAIMQIMADQLAGAIERTRLLQTVERNLKELEGAYGQYTLESWSGSAEGIQNGNRGYRFDNIRIQSITELTELGKEAFTTGKTITFRSNHQKSENQNTVAIPIKLRGQTIGVVTLKLKDDYSVSTVPTIESATERLALSMESARLYEEARLRADREQSISRVTTAISTPTDYEEILQTTVREVGKMLKDAEVAIQIVSNTDDDKQNE
jgi:putative methionine-R-sulfoxide reductase with GAF domain/HAMP domain-containing protein